MLSLVHQNIQGFSGKILNVELFLESEKIQILCLTEHWLKEHELSIGYNNFKIVSAFTRKIQERGGSLILVNNSIQAKERKDIVLLSIESTVELSCVELDLYIIICVYRIPGTNYATFENVMEDVLSNVIKLNKYVIVCGDFNINILEESSLKNKLLNLFLSYNLSHVFEEATRITPTTATGLDNIFCSKNCDVKFKGIINSLPSDHCGQIVKLPFIKLQKMIQIKFRPITNSQILKFKSIIEHSLNDLSSSTPCDTDPNILYRNMFNVLEKQYNAIFIVKTITRSNCKSFCDWATTGIHISRRKLYELYAEKTLTPDPDFHEYVKNYSKTFKRVCLAAKILHIKNKIFKSDDKVKTIWKMINQETGRSKLRDKDICLKVNDTKVNSPLEVANIFERFFKDIPSQLTNGLNSSPEAATKLLIENVSRCNKCFSFTKVSVYTIIKTFKQLKLKSTEDHWGLSVKVLKTIITSIAPLLAHIFNVCIKNGMFPDLMKLAKVIPLFKTGEKSDPNNYRPVAILPVLSKLFEKIMLNQMLYHFSTNGLFHAKQFGFTKGRSTIEAGIALISHIYNSWENSQDALGVFCDLSKAFDCVSHETLLSKLTHYGIREKSNELIRSYLSNRTHKININGVASNGCKMEMGVPQGSVLGPFLFLIYINDLPYLMEKSADIVLFADDTSLIFKIQRQSSSLDKANSALSLLLDWFSKNNLNLNAKKTNCIKFVLPNVRQVEAPLILGKETLGFVDKAVFLGLTLDSKLQWGPHIETLGTKLSSAAFAVKRIRQLADEQTAKLVYYAYFHSVMSYGVLLWGGAADVERIFILQKRAVRAIYNLKSRTTLREKFKDINILTLPSQYIYENIMYVRRNIGSFDRRCDLHSVNTRNKFKLLYPSFRLNKVSSSFKGLCIKCYNKLPSDVINLAENKFKKFVKNVLIKRAYYKVDDYLNDKLVWQ